MESEPLLPSIPKYPTRQSGATGETGEGNEAYQAANERAPRPVRTSELSGVVLMFLGAFTLSANAFLVHVAGSRFFVPPATTLFVRSIVHTLLSACYLVILTPIRETVGSLTRAQYLLLLLRGVVGGIAVMCMYIAFKLIPVGDVMAIFFISPAFTLVLSHFSMGEPITAVDIVAVVVSLTGAALMARPDSSDAELENAIPATSRIVGSLLTVFASMLASVAYTTIRYLGMTVHFMTSVFSLGFVGVFITVAMGGFVTPGQLVSYGYGGTAAIVGALISVVMQVFLNLGLQRCRAGPGTLIQNIEVPITYVLGLVFLNERPVAIRIIGASLIVSAAVIIGIRHLVKLNR